MNVLAAIASTPAGMIAGGLLPSPSRNASAAIVSNALLPANGFVNLINALLGSGTHAGDSDPDTQQDESTDSQLASGAQASKVTSQTMAQIGLRVASNTNIAQALIRSMLGASSDSAALSSDLKSVKAKPAAKSAQAAARDQVQTTTPVDLPFEAAIQRTSGDSTLNDAASDGSASGGAGKPSPEIAQPADLAKSQASQAPLAFSVRLTPLGNQPGNDAESDAQGPEAQGPDTQGPNAQGPALTPASPVEANGQQTIEADSKSKLAFSPAPARADVSDDAREDAAPRIAATASAGDFAHSFGNPAQPGDTQFSLSSPQMDSAKSASTFGAVADTLRASESPLADAANIASTSGPASPVQEISMRIAGPAMPSVDLRVTERAGEIHVDVRTPDADLETALRGDLGTLTNALDRAGYRTETFVPHESASTSGNGPLSTAQSSNMNSRDRHQEDGQQQQSGSSGRQSGGSGNHRQQQRPREQRAQDWINEMEKQQ